MQFPIFKNNFVTLNTFFYFHPTKKLSIMKKITALLAIATILLLNACKKTPTDTTIKNPEAIPANTINAFIKQELQANNKFDWSTASDEMVWSALQQSDKILSIGYKPADEVNIEDRLANIDITSSKWKDAKLQVMKMILQTEIPTRSSLNLNNMEEWAEFVLPVIDVKVENFETVKALRASNLVRYAEPMGYEPGENQGMQGTLSSSGCGSNVAETGLIAGTDYTTIAPNTKQSWNYTFHKIPNAWTKSTGAGIKVFIIDSGKEFDQENLGSAFNQGNSSARTVESIVTLPRSTFLGIPTGSVETPDDGCGHGTSMAGACAAPRGIDGAACGVAYNCNLVTCRAAADVYLDESREVKGASDAYTNAANRADVKIISMSMGKTTSSSQLRDAIKYAYGKGKLMFCAAGTSFGWTAGWFGVIFPGYLAEVNAVTGVRDNNFNSNCTDCHKGAETDFTVVMEKASNERHPITLAMTGNAPSTVGGSSVATATTSGMAALIWSRFPSFTRDQVLNKMIQNSSNYPNRNSNFGWGNVNVDAATN
jgi:subtilisin family serine protease